MESRVSRILRMLASSSTTRMVSFAGAEAVIAAALLLGGPPSARAADPAVATDPVAAPGVLLPPPDVTLRPPASDADGIASRHGIQQWGVKLGYGWSKQHQTGVIPVYGQAGWSFWDVIDRPLLRWHIDLQYIIEGWMAGVHNPDTSAFEIGLNPISLRVSYDRGQQFVPFAQGGIGVMYTSLQGIRAGGPFQFDELFGMGLEMFCNRHFALTVEYRYRHMSNAGISTDNRGLDTQFVLFGITEHPQR